MSFDILIATRAGKDNGATIQQTYTKLVMGTPLGKFEPKEAVEACREVYGEREGEKLLWLSNSITSEALKKLEIKEPTFIIDGVLPVGLSILAAKPKIGKSWMTLNISTGLASGKKVLNWIEIEQASVLYLALEDGKARLKRRLDTMGSTAPADLHFFTEWPRLDQGGLDNLNLWLDLNKNTKLVVIDTLQKVKPHTNGKRNIYETDYESLGGLQKLALERGIAVLAVHHLRKGTAEDIVDRVSGSNGLTGCADAILALERTRGNADATLHITGRDVFEQKLALRFEEFTGRWEIVGEADAVQMSDTRKQIVEFLNVEKRAKPKHISEGINRNANTIRVLLAKMFHDGTIRCDTEGFYYNE